MWAARIGRPVNYDPFAASGGVYVSNNRSLRYADNYSDISPSGLRQGRGPDIIIIIIGYKISLNTGQFPTPAHSVLLVQGLNAILLHDSLSITDGAH